MDNIKTCCICGKKFIGIGNNPFPINNDKNARCCNKCNVVYVNVARMTNINLIDIVHYYRFVENNERLVYGIK